MESFLRRTVDKLATITADGAAGVIHVVVGSEACDLDSAVSALCWAYYLSQTDDVASDGAAAGVVVPLLAVRRRDYAATRAVPRAHLQGECGLGEDLLVFLDDLDLAALAGSGRLALTLVDHNDVAAWHGSDDVGSTVARVRRIIDHHQPSNHAFPAGCDVIIEPVGSCSSLVAERVLADAKVGADKTLLKMLYGAIVYDTVCLSPSDGRTTSKDTSAVLAIEAALGLSADADRRRLFDTLCRAKSDLSGTATADLLLSDKKVAAGPHTRLLVPSLTTHAQSLLGRAAFADDLRRVTADERCDAAVVMTLGGRDVGGSEGDTVDGREPLPLRRHLIVSSQHSELLSWIADALLASDLKPVEDTHAQQQLQLLPGPGAATSGGLRVLEQSDHRQSRKQVLPLLQQIITDYDSRPVAGSGVVTAVPLLPDGDPWQMSPAAGSGGGSADPTRADGNAPREALLLDPFDSLLSSSSAWPSAAADGGLEQLQASTASADFFSFDATFGGASACALQAGDWPAAAAAPVAAPHSQQTAPQQAHSSNPFGQGDFLAGDSTMAKHEEDSWLTSLPTAAAAPAALTAGSSSDAGTIPSSAAVQANPFFDTDPFASTNLLGPSTGNPFGGNIATTASAVDPFGDVSAGNPFGDNPFGAPAVSADPFSFGAQPDLVTVAETDASLLSEANPVGSAAVFADRVTAASTPSRTTIAISALAGLPVDGGGSSSHGGTAAASAAVSSDADVGTLLPTAGGSTSPAAGVDVDLLTPARAADAEAPLSRDAGLLSSSTADERTADVGPPGGLLADDAIAPPEHERSPPPASEVKDAAAAAAAPAAAYDDEAFSGLTSAESSSPTTDGSAPSKYSFLSPSADLFRLTFVPDEARGSSVSSLDSAAAGALPADFPAASLDELAEMATAAAADMAALDAAVRGGRPADAGSAGGSGSGSPGGRQRAEGDSTSEGAEKDGAGGVWGTAASSSAGSPPPTFGVPTLPQPQQQSMAAVPELAQSANGFSTAVVVSAAAAAAAGHTPALSLLAPLQRPDLEGSRSSSVPGTPNNSYYDSAMFDKFAAVTLDGHKVTSRILQHQVKHEVFPAGSTSPWFVEESMMETAAAAAAAVATGADGASGGSSSVPPLLPLAGVSSTLLSDGRQGDAYDDHGSARGGSLLAVGQRSAGALPLTPANSYADSFRPPDGGWPSATGHRGAKDALSLLSSSDMLQKVLQKKAALIRDSDDGLGGGRGSSTPGTPSPGGPFDSAVSDHSSPPYGGGAAVRRRSMDSGASEEGVFEFDSDDADVAGSGVVAVMTAAATATAAIAAAATSGQTCAAAQPLVLADPSCAGGDGPVTATAEATAHVTSVAVETASERAASVAADSSNPAEPTSSGSSSVETAAACGAPAGVAVTASAAATFVSYLASVDPLHGHLDLVADGAIAELRPHASAAAAGGGSADGVRSIRSASLGGTPAMVPSAGNWKRHSIIADRLEAQIVEGVDIEELTASDATAAALVRRASLDSVGSAARRASLDSIGSARRLLSAAAATAAATAHSDQAAVATRSLAFQLVKDDDGGDGDEHGVVQRLDKGQGDSDGSKERVSPRFADDGESEPNIAAASPVSEAAPAGAAAVQPTAAAELQQQQQQQFAAPEEARCTALAEQVVAGAMRSAMATLSGEAAAAASAASAASDPAVAAGDAGSGGDSAAYRVAAQSIVGRVLAEAGARLRCAGEDDDGSFGDDGRSRDETAAGGSGHVDAGGRKYSDWMIDAVLGSADDAARPAEAEAAVVEESVVPASAGTVASAAAAGASGRRVLGANGIAAAVWSAPSPDGASSPDGGSLEAVLDAFEDVETPDDSGAQSFIDPSLLQELGDMSSDSGASSGGLPSGDQQQQPYMDTIPLDSSDDAPAEWCDVTVAGREHRVDMRAIKPYCKLISHGGLYDGQSGSVLLVFTASHFPSRSLKNYGYIMDNLLLYVLSGIELMVPEGRDYAILYFHGGADKTQLPSMAFLKRCRDEAHSRLRKSLKMLYLVHPTMWLRSVALCSRAIVSSKFTRKIVYVQSLEVLRKVLSLEYVTIPAEVVEFDKQRARTKK